MSVRPTLGYWDMRGKGQAIRNLLVLADIDFEDKRYPNEPDRVFQEVKALGFESPNMPYWIDDQVKLTPAAAIIKYIAKKYGFIGEDSATLNKQEMIEQRLVQYYSDFTVDNSEKCLEQLAALSSTLGDNEWFTGQFSYVDSMAYELLDWFRLMDPAPFGHFPTLNHFLARFENLPRIKEYHNSGKFDRMNDFKPDTLQN